MFKNLAQTAVRAWLRWTRECDDCGAKRGAECHWACSSNWHDHDDSDE